MNDTGKKYVIYSNTETNYPIFYFSNDFDLLLENYEQPPNEVLNFCIMNNNNCYLKAMNEMNQTVEINHYGQFTIIIVES